MQLITQDSNYKRTTNARVHRDYILLALRILEKATTGPITNWINERLKAEMEQTRISKRGVQFILPKLEAEGLVSKNGYNEYSLTKEGQSAKIFANSYGKTLFDKLAEIPFKGTEDQKILECVKRFGLYIVYIFIRNSSPTVASSFYEGVGENDLEWINEAVDLKTMFECFSREVYSKTQKYSSRSKNFWVLMKRLESEFPEYFPTLLKSEGDYFKSAFPDYYKRIIMKKVKKVPK